MNSGVPKKMLSPACMPGSGAFAMPVAWECVACPMLRWSLMPSVRVLLPSSFVGPFLQPKQTEGGETRCVRLWQAGERQFVGPKPANAPLTPSNRLNHAVVNRPVQERQKLGEMTGRNDVGRHIRMVSL